MARLLIYLESLWLVGYQLLKSVLMAWTGIAGLSGGLLAVVLFVISAGYFYPHLKDRSRSLFLIAGAMSLIGGTLLLNEIGQSLGLSQLWERQALAPVSIPSEEALATPDATPASSVSAPPLGPGSGGTDMGSATPPSTWTPDPVYPAVPTYRVMPIGANEDPILWSTLDTGAYAIASIPRDSTITLNGMCVTDTVGNGWCPTSYGFASGWISSAALVPN